MRGRICKCAIVLAMVAISLGAKEAAFARETKTLEPATPWNVDWSQEVCALRRGFKNGQALDVFTIERFAPTAEFQFLVISKDVESYTEGNKVTLSFGNNSPNTIVPMVAKTQDRRHSLITGSVGLVGLPETMKHDDEPWPEVSPATEAAVTFATLKVPGRDLVFHTGPMDKPFAALRACTADLVKSWGLDPAQQASLTRKPTPLTKPAGWLTSGDYPKAMAVAGKQAQVSFRLMVDASGKPSSCVVQRSYNDPKFDTTTCDALMRRARFLPALDKDAKPVASYYINLARWVMFN